MEKFKNKTTDEVYSILSSTQRSPQQLELVLTCMKSLEDLHNCTSILPKHTLIQIASNLFIEGHKRNSIIFNQGDKSDKIYIVMRGRLNMLDGCGKLSATLKKGSMVGERDLIKDQPRSLTAVAKTNVLLLILDGEIFKNIIAVNIKAEHEEKLAFLCLNIPNLKLYSNNVKEKVAHIFDLEVHHKRAILLEEGNFTEYVYFVFDGEVMLSKASPPDKTNILTVSCGCSIGDECVFLGKLSEFTATVHSETLRIYKAKRSDLLAIIPDDILKKLEYLSRRKYFSRKEIIGHTKVKRRSTNLSHIRQLPMATENSERLIFKTASRIGFRGCNFKCDEMKEILFKNRLEKLRDITVKRFFKFHKPFPSICEDIIRPILLGSRSSI